MSVSCKRYKFECTYSKDSDQSALPQSDQSLSFLLEETLDPWQPTECPSDCADVQIDLSLQWVHMPTCNFCWIQAHTTNHIIFTASKLGDFKNRHIGVV